MTTARPIVHRDEYAAEVERPVVEWFRDVIFGPLLDIVEDAGVEPDPADQGGQGNLNAKEGDWIPFEASLGWPRESMPQIRSADRPRVVAYLREINVASRERRVPADHLLPTQSHYSPEKVEDARVHRGPDRPILVARDLRILDGHHQWLGTVERDPRALVDVVEFDERISPLISHAKIALANVRENAKTSAVADALASGRVWYANGAFTGQFSARVARELRTAGATYSETQRAFLLPEARLPADLKVAAVGSAARSKEMHDRVGRTLDGIQENLPRAKLGLETGKASLRIASDLQRQFRLTLDDVKALAVDTTRETAVEQITVSADVTPTIARALDEQLTNNLDLYIKKFAEEQIPELRRKVAENAFNGGRADRLAKIIESSFGVSKRKAAFLAEQETSLLVSKFREQRYREIGSTAYKWSTSHDERVRADHRALDGKVFQFDTPPVTDRASGARNNPGEDFRCLPGDSRVEFCGEIEKGFRRWYSGELTTLVLCSGKTIRATPNHPVLTINGWKAIGALDQSDHVIELTDEAFRIAIVKTEGEQRIATIREKFESLGESSLCESFMGQREQFHGDGADSHVDVIWATGRLLLNRETDGAKCAGELAFIETATLTPAGGRSFEHSAFRIDGHQAPADMATCGQSPLILDGQLAHSEEHGLGSPSNGDTGFEQSATDYDSFKACALRNGQFAFSAEVSFDERFWINLKAIAPVRAMRVHKVRSGWFNGHVYNLQTNFGYYTTDGVIVSNCRCVAIPILVFPK